MANSGYRKKEGPQGAPGDTGSNGSDGRAATIDVGKVSVGDRVSVTNVGTPEQAVFDFVFLRGQKGDKGDRGPQGSTGLTGPQGPQGIPGEGIGEVCEAVELVTNSAAYQTIYSFPTGLNSTHQIKAEIVGRKADGSEHCSFKRTALAWNESAVATLFKIPHSDHTLETNNQFDVRYVISGTSVNIQVRATNSDTHNWKGRVCTLSVSTV